MIRHVELILAGAILDEICMTNYIIRHILFQGYIVREVYDIATLLGVANNILLDERIRRIITHCGLREGPELAGEFSRQ